MKKLEEQEKKWKRGGDDDRDKPRGEGRGGGGGMGGRGGERKDEEMTSWRRGGEAKPSEQAWKPSKCD